MKAETIHYPHENFKHNKCGICLKEIKGAEYKISRNKEKMWVCEDCYLDDEPIEE